MIILAAVLLMIIAGFLWWLAGHEQGATGLPAMRVKYDDSGAKRTLEQPLVSHRYRLTGRPDYLLEQRGKLIPVEVKPMRRAANPYESDLMQLAAYCLLVEEDLGERPPYGLLRYATQSWEIPWDGTRRRALLATLVAMKKAEHASDVARSHQQPARCAQCSQRGTCNQALN